MGARIPASPNVARNLEAARTAELIPCPQCGQGVGEACVTNATRDPRRRRNVAAFTHMKRVRLRYDELLAEEEAAWEARTERLNR